MLTRNIQVLNFFDIYIDFIVIESFKELDNVPGAITAVLNNSWLSAGFKESAIATATSQSIKVTKKKFNCAKYNGFMLLFYAFCEYLTPALAWGFLGTDKQLNEICKTFKVFECAVFFQKIILQFKMKFFQGSIHRFCRQYIQSKHYKLFKFGYIDGRH